MPLRFCKSQVVWWGPAPSVDDSGLCFAVAKRVHYWIIDLFTGFPELKFHITHEISKKWKVSLLSDHIWRSNHPWSASNHLIKLIRTLTGFVVPSATKILQTGEHQQVICWFWMVIHVRTCFWLCFKSIGVSRGWRRILSSFLVACRFPMKTAAKFVIFRYQTILTIATYTCDLVIVGYPPLN